MSQLRLFAFGRIACALLLSLATLLAVAEDVEFELQWESTSTDGIVLFIESNLPDTAEVKVSIRRTYEATSAGESDTYSLDHFREDGSLGQWREPRRIAVDPETWRGSLLSHQNEMAQISKERAFEIDDIASDIAVTAYVYANKTGERYGRREYESLIEKIQNTELVAKSEIQVRLPLITAERIPRRSTFVAFDGLEAGETYRLLSERTPLMPTLQAETVADLQYTPLPAGTIIKVEEVTRVSGDYWYQVTLAATSRAHGMDQQHRSHP